MNKALEKTNQQIELEEIIQETWDRVTAIGIGNVDVGDITDKDMIGAIAQAFRDYLERGCPKCRELDRISKVKSKAAITRAIAAGWSVTGTVIQKKVEI